MQAIREKTLTIKTKKSTTSLLTALVTGILSFRNAARIAFSIFGLAVLILLAAETSRAQQFCSTTPITIPASGSSGISNPYPSTINVSGLNGTISNVTVTLNNLQHAFANDIDILLVGPQGQKFIILSDTGGDAGFRNTPVVLTLSDAGAALVPNPIGTAIPSGTYKPTNGGATADTFPSVAGPYSSPATAGSATFASVFNTTNPNGDWKLYVVDDNVDPGGSMSGGWCLNLTIIAANPGQLQLEAPAFTFDEKDGTKQVTVTRTNGVSGAVTVDYATSNGTAIGGASCGTPGVDYIAASGTLTFPDGVTSQTIPVTLCNDAVDEPEETINIALSNPTGGATLGTPGAAVITLVRIEQFCAGTSITIPTFGAANPYPSTVNVSGLTGTISNVSVKLTNLQHEQANDVDILLVGPNGQKFIILSDAGQRFGYSSPVTLTLSDAGTAHIPSTTTGTIPAGIYKPTNYGDASNDTFSSPAPPAPYEYPAPDGTQTFASVFSGTNPNGEWKLFVFDDANSSSGSIAGGWCLSISTVQATPGQFQFSASNYTFEENQLSAVIGVRRTGGSVGAVSVDYATSNGTAVGGASCTAGVDYINTGGTLSFADGETGEKTFTVQMCRDQSKSGIETVNLQLSNPTGGAVLGTPSTAALNIEDSLPSRLGFALNYSSTSDFQPQTVMIPVSRNNLSELPVTDSATYTTGGGTATGGASCTAGVDYITATGTVTFAPNVDVQEVPVTICSDAAAEQLEFFELTLSNPSPGAEIRPASTTTKVIIAENQPTVYMVNSTSDVTDGICDATRCTLFEAALAANGAPSADEIRFDPAVFNQPRVIEREDPITLNHNVSIIGTGTSLLTIRLRFSPTVFITNGNVSIRDLTITGFGSSGQAFLNTGTLNLTNLVLKEMSTNEVGVVINDGGTITMTSCSVIDNSGDHGGVNNRGGGTFNIINSLIARNTGDTRGGGVRNENGTVNITNSTISGNLTDNAGGIYNAVGTVNINYSTIYGNKQDDVFPDPKVGGILNATGATVNIKNSIVAGNLNTNNSPSDLSGAFVSQGYNLIGTTDGSTGITNGMNGDKAGTNAAPINPMLAPLANNGGLTLTHALLAGSPAIDAANPANDLTSDQRGFLRPFDGDGNGSALSDIGAFEFGAANAAVRTPFDFDGDGRADLSVFRPSDGIWYVNRSSSNQLSSAQFGLSSDRLTPADYDGDGKTDLAVYRNGEWHISQSSNSQLRSVSFGLAGDIPVPGDFDGDQKADIAVFRPSDGVWYRLNSSNGQFTAAQFGSNGDIPVIGDFNGDGKSDLAVFRPSNGFWYIARPTGVPAQNFDAVQFGLSTDIPVAADYDGDGKADVAVFREGVWYILQSSNGQMRVENFGLASDRLVPADYDGDGKADLAVYRGDGEWYVQRTTAGFGAFKFGLASDKAVPNSYINP